MDNVTHSLCGVLLERWICAEHHPTFTLRRTIAAAAAANLPDLDLLLRLDGPDAYIFFHRGISHSLLLLLLIPPLLAWGLKRWLGLSFRTCWLLLAMSLGSHLFLDVLTSWGTQLLAPFSTTRFALNWVFIVDPMMVFCLVLGIVLGRRSGRRYRQRRWGAQWGFGLLGLYLFVAAMGHGVAIHQIRSEVAKQAYALPATGTHPIDAYRPRSSEAGPNLRVEAIPAPLAPLLWNGLALTSDGRVYHYSINLLRGEAELQATISLDMEDPLAQAFFLTDTGRHYLSWARFPHVERIAPETILVEDLRYSYKGLEALARPGTIEVQRDIDGAIIHHWVLQPMPK